MRECVMFHEIDLETYPRRDHFEHFLTMGNPFVTVTKQVDLSEWLPKVREAKKPFFLSFQYAAVHAANAVPEFRRRIRGGGIVEYDFCNPTYTVALPDGTYRYCLVHADQPFEAYLREGKEKQEAAVRSEHLTEEGEVESLLFISSTPWLNYESLTMPYPDRSFSIPSIAWGKCERETKLVLREGEVCETEKITMPVTVMVHHALADGIHLGQFFDRLEENLRDPFGDKI